MPVTIPATQESVDLALSILETSLNQDAPENEKAFTKVLAALLGMQQTAQYKYGVIKAKQNLALTATGYYLEILGKEHDIYKKPTTKWQGTGYFFGEVGTVLPVGTSCENEETGLFYITTKSYTIPVAGWIYVDLQADEYGPDSNLSIPYDKVTIVPEIEGAAQIIQITSTTQLGAAAESQDDFRVRVLDEIRTVGGGSNLADYRKWSGGVEGVARGYPYTGVSPDFSQSIPGYRTVFVRAQDDIDPDGIAPQALLDAVRVDLNLDPETGLSRPCLGSVDSQLAVESIYRTGFYFEVRDLVVSAANQAAARTDIDAALDKYARGRKIYILGLDAEIDKDDVLTSAGASQAAQQALIKYGGYLSSVGFGKVAGQFLPPYKLLPGEFAKKQAVSYVP